MNKEQNNSGGKDAPSGNRALYVTVLLVLIAMAVVVGVSTAFGRRKGGLPNVSESDFITSAVETTRAPVTTALPSFTTTPAITTATPQATTAAQTTTPTALVIAPANTLPDFILPVSGVVSKQYDGAVLVWSKTMEDYRIHDGVDISCRIGDTVCAAAGGVIGEITSDPLMGNCISVLHSGGAETYYKNLADGYAEGVEVGAEVVAGQALGTVGESAIVEIAEEPHLHFEMKIGGVSVNPLDYFGAASVAASADNTFED